MINVADYVEQAAAKVDPRIWCYFEGGAGDEVTLRANVAAYARLFETSPAVTWRDLEWIRTECDLPLVVKGILTREDATLAVEHGADAVWVSNHGGRQLDGVAAGLDALPEAVEAVAGRCEIYVDGGIRRGTDVLKALALGARAAFAGRGFAG